MKRLREIAILMVLVLVGLTQAGCKDVVVDVLRFYSGCEVSKDGTFEGFTCNDAGLLAWLLAHGADPKTASLMRTSALALGGPSGGVSCSSVKGRTAEKFQAYLEEKTRDPNLFGPNGYSLGVTALECGRSVRRTDAPGWLVEMVNGEECITVGAGLCRGFLDLYYSKPEVEVVALGDFDRPEFSVPCLPEENDWDCRYGTGRCIRPLYCAAAELASDATDVFVEDMLWSTDPRSHCARGAVRDAHKAFHQEHSGRETGAEAREHLEEIAATLILAGVEDGARFAAPDDLWPGARSMWWALDDWARQRGYADFGDYSEKKGGGPRP